MAEMHHVNRRHTAGMPGANRQRTREGPADLRHPARYAFGRTGPARYPAPRDARGIDAPPAGHAPRRGGPPPGHARGAGGLGIPVSMVEDIAGMLPPAPVPASAATSAAVDGCADDGPQATGGGPHGDICAGPGIRGPASESRVTGGPQSPSIVGDNWVTAGFDPAPGPSILTIGCGGAGSHSVTNLYNSGAAGTLTAAVNTDRPDLEGALAHKRVLIGTRITNGLGTGGDPELARRCADSSTSTLSELVEGVNLIFVTAGLGGGTGTGVAPEIARMARENGTVVVAMVTLPFALERERARKAREGLEELRRQANCVIAIDNERLVTEAGNRPLTQAFGHIDDFIAGVIGDITRTITRRSALNLDFADVSKVLSLGGVGTLLFTRSSVMEPDIVLGELMNNPLCDVHVRGAKGALIQMTAGTGLTLSVMEQISMGVASQLSPEAHVVTGVRIDPEMGDGVRVVALVTGLDDPDEKPTNAVAVLEELAGDGGDRRDRGADHGGPGGSWGRWDVPIVA